MENHLSTLIPDLDWPYHLDVTPNAHTLVMLKFEQLSQQAQMAYTLLVGLANGGLYIFVERFWFHQLATVAS